MQNVLALTVWHLLEQGSFLSFIRKIDTGE